MLIPYILQQTLFTRAFVWYQQTGIFLVKTAFVILNSMIISPFLESFNSIG
jgi:hypothetical protein